MFESIVASVLNNVLGKYIKDLDSSNLRLGILKGEETSLETVVAEQTAYSIQLSYLNVDT